MIQNICYFIKLTSWQLAKKSIIMENPDFHMEERLLLDKIDYEQGTIRLGDEVYPLNDTHFPTIDPNEPYRLTEEEEWAISRVTQSFKNSNRLDEHIRFLFSKVCMIYLMTSLNL